MKYLRIVFLLLITMVVFSACGGPKKCNGKRGTRVQMGTM